MVNQVRISPALPPGDEWSGLNRVAEELNEDPLTLRVAVIKYDAGGRYAGFPEDGIRIPYVRLRGFEDLGPAKAVPPAVQQAVADAVQERTGEPMLPLDQVGTADEGDD